MQKQTILLLLRSSVHPEDAGRWMFSLLKLLSFTAADPTEECTGYLTPSGAGVWKGKEFLEMHVHYCSQFVVLSKDLGCVKMHCSLFPKTCCYFSLQTATIPRPPQNNLNLLSCISQSCLNATSQARPCPDLFPLWLPKLSIGSFWPGTPDFLTSAEQESRSRPQC